MEKRQTVDEFHQEWTHFRAAGRLQSDWGRRTVSVRGQAYGRDCGQPEINSALREWGRQCAEFTNGTVSKMYQIGCGFEWARSLETEPTRNVPKCMVPL
jgi:hypothetical protein